MKALTRGSVALKQCGDEPTKIAIRTGASYPVIHNWMGGHRKPNDEWRVVLEKTYQIKRTWWEEEPLATLHSVPTGGFLDKISGPVLHRSQPPGPPPMSAQEGVSVVGGPAVPIDARGEAQTLVAQIRKFRAQVDTDPVESLSSKAKIIHGVTADLDRLFRLTGEAANIPEARILASPGWGRIRAAIVAALESHPAALAAVVAALEGFPA